MADKEVKSTLTATPDQEPDLIAIVKSSDASRKAKMDACRELARFSTQAAVAPLAALLGDEELSHMARYGLETNPDPSVDEAFREALEKLKGLPLVGVIGSIGVRRDKKAAESLGRLLKDSDDQVAQAAARALGNIGCSKAAKAFAETLDTVSPVNRKAFCEGAFRTAETRIAENQATTALALYDRLRKIPDAPHQIRTGALRGAVLTRGEKGLPLLLEALRGEDYALVEAAAHISHEMPGAEVTRALASELGNLPADKQILLIQTLGDRGDATALPALFALVGKAEKPVRLEAVRNLARFGNPKAVPVLKELLKDSDQEIRQAAQASLNALG